MEMLNVKDRKFMKIQFSRLSQILKIFVNKDFWNESN